MIPGFPVAKIIEEWGSIRDKGSIIKPPSKMAVSGVTWLLLLTINVYHSFKKELKEENELLKPYLRLLESKITLLTGQTAHLQLLLYL